MCWGGGFLFWAADEASESFPFPCFLFLYAPVTTVAAARPRTDRRTWSQVGERMCLSGGLLGGGQVGVVCPDAGVVVLV